MFKCLLNVNYGLVVKKSSSISGDGLFLARDISTNFNFGPIFIKESGSLEYVNHIENDYNVDISPFIRIGHTRYINHSYSANCRLEKHDDILLLYSVSALKKDDEITVNYIEVFEAAEMSIPKNYLMENFL